MSRTPGVGVVRRYGAAVEGATGYAEAWLAASEAAVAASVALVVSKPSGYVKI